MAPVPPRWPLPWVPVVPESAVPCVDVAEEVVVGVGLSAAFAIADPPIAKAATAATDAAAMLIFLTFIGLLLVGSRPLDDLC